MFDVFVKGVWNVTKQEHDHEYSTERYSPLYIAVEDASDQSYNRNDKGILYDLPYRCHW